MDTSNELTLLPKHKKEYYCAACGGKMVHHPDTDRFDRQTGEKVWLSFYCVGDTRSGHEHYYVHATSQMIFSADSLGV